MAKQQTKIRLAALEDDADGLDRKTYEERLKAVQERLLAIQQAYLMQKRRAVIVFEGADAAGKGGTIRRLTSYLDPRFCKVWPISAPDDHERGQHYLQRFFSRLPGEGTMVVFDRSWYGRVLVERVEGLALDPVWRRAFNEIVTFEKLLTDEGIRVIKLYLHVSQEEQAKRFLDRLTDPVKRWKITRRDFEARAFYHGYTKAAEEMIDRTHRPQAPWIGVSFERKWYGHVVALTAIADHLAEGVDLAPPPLDPELRHLAHSVLGVELPDNHP